MILLDARPDEEYEAGHLPGARSILWTDIEERLDELASNATIVAYCRGPDCVYTDTALGVLADLIGLGWAICPGSSLPASCTR